MCVRVSVVPFPVSMSVPVHVPVVAHVFEGGVSVCASSAVVRVVTDLGAKNTADKNRCPSSAQRERNSKAMMAWGVAITFCVCARLGVRETPENPGENSFGIERNLRKPWKPCS